MLSCVLKRMTGVPGTRYLVPGIYFEIIAVRNKVSRAPSQLTCHVQGASRRGPFRPLRSVTRKNGTE